jgi:hypothetical protein
MSQRHILRKGEDVKQRILSYFCNVTPGSDKVDLDRCFPIYLDKDMKFIMIHSKVEKNRLRIWFEKRLRTWQSPLYSKKVQIVNPEMHNVLKTRSISECLYYSDKALMNL